MKRFIKAFGLCVGVLLLGITFKCDAQAEGFYNVTDYGANGTDSTTDNEEINEALEECGQAGGGTVYIPSGTYYLKKTLVIYSNTTLKLDNTTVLKMTKPGTTTMLRNYSGYASTVFGSGSYTTSKNITITGGIWDGGVSGATYDKADDLIRIFCSTGITIKNATFQNVCGNHFLNFEQVNTADISNVTFRNMIKYYNSSDSKNPDYTVLENGNETVNKNETEASVTSEAIQLDYYNSVSNYCKNISVTGCTFRGVISGIGNHHEETSGQHITIKNNTFYDVENACLNLYNFKDVKASSNRAYNVRSFARVCSGSDILLEGNFSAAWSGRNAFNVFRVSDGANLVIKGNTISGSGQDGITLSDSTAVITYNSISNVARRGISLYSGSRSDAVSFNTISNCGTNGIHISGQGASSYATKVRKNTITGNRNGSGISVLDATVINIGGKGNENIIKDCQYGMYIRNGTVSQITYNAISGNSRIMEYGIWIRNSSSKIKVNHNSISNATYAGICGSVSKAPIANNTITGVGKYGIMLQGGSYSVKKNMVYNAPKVALYVTGYATAGEVSSNYFSVDAKNNKKSYGVCVDAGSSLKTLKGNTITGKMTFGMKFFSVTSTTTISGNKVISQNAAGVKFAGIVLNGDLKKITVKSNTVMGNRTDYGICLNSGKAEISKNTVTKNKIPICIKSKLYDVKVKENKISSNTKNVIKVKKKEINSKEELKSVIALRRAGEIKISLKKDSSFSSYKIYQSTKESESYKKIKTLKTCRGCKYTKKHLQSGTRYYYKVQGYSEIGRVKVSTIYSESLSTKAK